MKKFIVGVVASLILLLGSTQAKAYYLEITPGGSVDVTGMTSKSFSILFNPGATSVSLGTYAFNLFYDTNELTWNSGSTSISPPSPLSAMFGNPSEGTSGHITNFNGASFSGDATISSPVTLATVAFNIASGVNNPAGDGFADIWFDTSSAGTGFTINGSNISMASMTVSGSAPDVAVAPEPISSILFLTGGAVLGARRFIRKKV